MRFCLIVPFLLLGACATDYDLVHDADGGSANTEQQDGLMSSRVRPIAQCGVSDELVRPVRDSVEWTDAGSYDPEGRDIVEYQWSLVDAPEGTSFGVDSIGNGLAAAFAPDLAGVYQASLVVVTDDGRTSEPCTVSMEAIPMESLWVEMFWSQAGDDMDLHLVAPNGIVNSQKDCNYTNCQPGNSVLDWGVQGDSNDDPRLDLDDIDGVGPENINIQEPTSGSFKVMVHDYPNSIFQGDNAVTVNVYVDGVKVWSRTKSITGEDVYVPFASIDWDTQEITEL